jgi:alanine-glyoxylate transaminase / serine-glyoxylate transaminase / serine-pyruvate transaminase
MKNTPYKLMIPGPIQPGDKVMEAMGKPVQPHYGPEFRDYYNETTSLLKKVYNTSGDVFLLVGSGSAAIDACIGSLVPSGGKILVGVNGFFGERMKSIAENYNMEVLPVTAEWGQPLRAEDFENAMMKYSGIKAVAVVHLETSTTVINPAEEIGHIARKHDLPFILDTVSSLGGLPVYMDDWGVDLCASASQKCLGAPPGLAPVAVGERGWEAIKRNPKLGHGWYLNLNVWREFAKEWGDWHPFPITMATNLVAALRVSLEELMKEGVDARQRRFRSLALRLRTGLRRIGMTPFTADEVLAPVITAANGPEGVATGLIVEYMSAIHHIKIAGGLGALKDKIFRIGHMSPSISEPDIDDVVRALESFRSDWKDGKLDQIANPELEIKKLENHGKL